MSKGKSGNTDLMMVAGICLAMSLIVWLFLVLFHDELFAPSDRATKAHAEAAASESSSKTSETKVVKKTVAPASTANSSDDSDASTGTAIRLTASKVKSASRVPDTQDRTFFDGDSDERSASEQTESESATERSTRLMRETLGIAKRKPPTHALDVTLVGAGECVKPDEKTYMIPVLYSHNGSTVRGASLVGLNAVLGTYRRCGQGFFKMTTNPSGDVDASESLMQMRFDELKYFFKQNGVPEEALKFPSNL